MDHGSIENGSAASDLPPEGPKTKRWADLTHLEGLYSWGQGLSNGLVETRFYDIFNFFIKIVEIDHGSIENGSAASDLPPKGSKKKRWADLAHVPHFGNLAHFSGFTTQDSGLRTQNSGLRTQDSELNHAPFPFPFDTIHPANADKSEGGRVFKTHNFRLFQAQPL